MTQRKLFKSTGFPQLIGGSARARIGKYKYIAHPIKNPSINKENFFLLY